MAMFIHGAEELDQVPPSPHHYQSHTTQKGLVKNENFNETFADKQN